jgi:hypothetical protein
MKPVPMSWVISAVVTICLTPGLKSFARRGAAPQPTMLAQDDGGVAVPGSADAPAAPSGDEDSDEQSGQAQNNGQTQDNGQAQDNGQTQGDPDAAQQTQGDPDSAQQTQGDPDAAQQPPANMQRPPADDSGDDTSTQQPQSGDSGDQEAAPAAPSSGDDN